MTGGDVVALGCALLVLACVVLELLQPCPLAMYDDEPDTVADQWQHDPLPTGKPPYEFNRTRARSP